MESKKEENVDLYSFEVEEDYVAKVRISIFASGTVNDQLIKLGKKQKKKLSRNKMALKIIEDALKQQYFKG